MRQIDERFWSKVEKTDTCWLWTASVNQSGYGQFGVGKEVCLAHRLAYEDEHGPIPEGLEIDHLCRVRHCVRPDHLEAVTHAENMRRSCRKTCPRGHIYDKTYRNGKRACSICANERWRDYYWRRLAPTRRMAD